MPDAVLMDGDVERFVREGVFLLKGAVSREIADECRQLLWAATGCDEHEPTTWTKLVIRIEGRGDAPFAAAVNTERLRAAFDQLAGRDRWVPRNGIETFPIRFPVREPPDDDGWHIESTGANAKGDAIVDPGSRERVLLMLVLFSDVGPDDAPTRVRLGSHHYAARLLVGTGKPVGFLRAANELVPQTEHLLEVAATGQAGDVWLCHPFVVHAGQRHRGARVTLWGNPRLPALAPLTQAVCPLTVRQWKRLCTGHCRSYNVL